MRDEHLITNLRCGVFISYEKITKKWWWFWWCLFFFSGARLSVFNKKEVVVFIYCIQS